MSELGHFDREIYELDERIGRLALLCGADLSRPEVVLRLIKGQFEDCSRPEALTPLRREELRGLLLLKYKIEASCLEAVGPVECARIIAEQEALLRQRSFPPQSQVKADDNAASRPQGLIPPAHLK